MDSMAIAKMLGESCITGRVIAETDAVMFDIDETLIHVDGTPIIEMISLLNKCRDMGYNVIIITARPDYPIDHHYTKCQLISFGIYPHAVYFVPPHKKTKVKEQTGLRYLLSVGDLCTDLGGSDYWIKLPDENDNHVYSNINDF